MPSSVSFTLSVVSDRRTRLWRFLPLALMMPALSSSRRALSDLTRLAIGSRTVSAV